MLNLVKRPIGLDDLAEVRYLHASSFRMCGASHHTMEEIDSCQARINSPEYNEECLNCGLYGLWYEDALIGTAGWSPSSDNRSTARIRKIYIHNYFIGLGFGRMMVETAEELAAYAGFHSFSVRTSPSAEEFFAAIGYHVSSHGLLATPKGPNIPVTYMRKQRSVTLPIDNAFSQLQPAHHH